MAGNPPEEGGESGSAFVSKGPGDLAHREGRMVGHWESQSSLPWPAVRGRTVQERRGRGRAHTMSRMETWEEERLAAEMWSLVARCTTGQEGKAT